jgi:hypothetical protein
MFELIDADPAAGQVRRITFVPFLADGRCVLITEPGGPALPAGEVRAGEDYVLDTVLRVPLETVGFRYQRFHPFALDGNHLYAWIEGAPYSGDRPHRTAQLLLRRGSGRTGGRPRHRPRHPGRGPVVPVPGRAGLPR